MLFNLISDKVKFLLVTTILLSNLITFSQANCYKETEVIPSGRQIYMIGEEHLDNPIRERTIDEMAIIKSMALSEDAIRKHLTTNCKVTHFIMESPVFTEYFYNKFISTGDTSWLHYSIEGQQYQMSKIFSVAELAMDNPAIKLHCIDLDFDKYNTSVINTLFFVSFYESIPELFNHPANAGKNAFNLLFDEKIIWSSTAMNDTIKPFLAYILNAAAKYQDTSSLQMLMVFQSVIKDQTLLIGLKNFYKENFEYVYRLMCSFIYSYKVDINTDEGFRRREYILYSNFMEQFNKDPYSNYCLQMGAFHVLENDNPDVMRNFLDRKFYTSPYVILMLPYSYLGEFSNALNRLDFNFSGCCCLQYITVNESCYLIKN